MDPGIIVVHNLPKEFAEKELEKYFNQFGTVSRVRVARSRKTRSTKGYAYLQFESKDVAEIAAQSMNNYLMFGRVIRCQMVNGTIAKKVFSKKNNTKHRQTTVQRHRARCNDIKNAEQESKIVKRRRKMIYLAGQRLAKFGINFSPVIINAPEGDNN